MNNKRIKVKGILLIVIVMLFICIGSVCIAKSDQEQLEEDQQEFGSVTVFIRGVINSISFNIFNIAQSGLRASNNGQIITIDTLVFDHFSETDINFFKKVDQTSIIGRIKSKVETWYTRFRSIAMVCYLIFLLYVGIRILLASAGKQQEKYKEMLISWGQGVLLLLFFPLLLNFVIQINHAFVGMIEEKTRASLGISATTTNVDLGSIQNPSAGADNQAIASNLDANPFDESDNNYMARQAARAKKYSIADAVVFLIMVFQFILILIAYYKRLFMTGFLISIFPIVMILYPIDKLNDGKSQSFSSWAKELFLNIFTQTFHAICYIFVMAATEAAANDWILALVAVTFLFKAEEVIKNILGLGGSATVKSPAASMAKAAVALGAVNKITNTFSSTAEKVVTGSRMMREARTMGYKSIRWGTKKTRNDKREKGVSRTYNALLNSPYNPSRNTQGSSGAELSGAAVSGPTEAQADRIGEAFQDADLATFNKNGNDEMTFAMMAAINNPQNENLAKALEEKGLSKDGKRSLATLSQATSEFQNAMTGLDPNSADYKEKVKKIKGKFDEKIKVAFPGMNEKGRKNMAHAAYKAMRMGAGVQNNKNFDLGETRKSFDKKRKMIAGKNAVIDAENLSQRKKQNGGMGLFAQEDYTDKDGDLKLFGYAKQMENKYFEALSKDEKCGRLGLKERKQMAKDLAVLATTREQSKLSNDELRENFLAIRGKSKAAPAEGKRQFTMSNAMQMFTAKTTLEAAERLQSVNVTQLDGALDNIVLEGVGSEREESAREDLGDDTLGFGAEMEEVLAIVDEMVVQEAGTEIDENNPGTILSAMGEFEDRLHGEERTAATDETRREVVKNANKENQQVVKKAKQRKEVKKKEAGRSTKMSIEQAMQIQNEMHSKGSFEGTMDNPFESFNLKEEIMRSELENAGAAAALQSEIDRASGGGSSSEPADASIVYSEEVGSSAGEFTPVEGSLGQVESEDFWINSEIVSLREEKERQLCEGLDFLLGQEDEDIDRPDIGPNVDGYTEQEYIDKAKDMHKKGRNMILQALGSTAGMAVAGTTTGAMAIGLNTGANPMQEWLAGTVAGATALDGFGLGDKQHQIKVQDADGNVYTVNVDTYGLGADDLIALKADASGVYKLEDLKAMDPAFGQQLDLKINDQKAEKVRTKEEESRKLAEERASRRAGRISGALDSRRNNRNS